MKRPIRSVFLAGAGWALVGLAGCGEDNVKNAGDDFKNTKSAAPEPAKEQTKADVAAQYKSSGGGGGYPGTRGAKAPSAAPKKAP
jgi:hypothetical protein